MIRHHTLRAVFASLVLATVPAACVSAEQAAEGLSGTQVTGPVSGGDKGWIYRSPAVNLSQKGYVMEEYFVSGTANAYKHADGTEPSFDGDWQTEEAGEAPYKTRIYIVRPADPADFNGVLLAHWQNVTAGFENGAPTGGEVYDGYAWLGVTTQAISVYGTPSTRPFSLHEWDPARYGSLEHPGDAYSYDIFEAAVRETLDLTKQGKGPLAGLVPDTVIATGASQSAMRLGTYINAAHQHHDLFDGFLLSVHWGIIPPLEEIGLLEQFDVSGGGKNSAWGQINDRGDTPIMIVNSQAEALTNYPARQPDTDSFRFWEIAGTPHSPPRSSDASSLNRRRDGMDFDFDPTRNLVEWEYIEDAALRHLVTWVEDGTVPPKFDPIAIEKTPDGPVFRKDAAGNVLGGIRPPEVAAPIGVHTAGLPASELDGHTRLFDTSEMEAIHGTREQFIAAWNQSVDDLLASGLILPEEAERRRRRAAVFWKGEPTHAPGSD